MKIVHILNHTIPANGHVCAMVDLACTQAMQGHQVYVCSAGGGFDSLLAQYGIEHIIIDQDRRPIKLLKAVFKTRTALARIRPDIVHAHMMTSAVIAAVLRPISNWLPACITNFSAARSLWGLGKGLSGSARR
jgi:predicted glycosyltransferase